jgi:dihydrofolate synthase/folylpolyglutamate synthase
MSSTHLANVIDKLLSTDNCSPTLAEVQQIIKQLNIAPNYPIILVGGTNGKGSTCAYLSNILRLSGFKVGCFTSPHVFNYNERISINNQPISDDDLVKYLNQITDVTNSPLGLFKTFTLASHLYFTAKKIDIAVVEVGIGGNRDITNIFTPTISAITGVDFDHCYLLGDTLDEIGLEKAHIYRPHKWAFYGSNNPPSSVINYATEIAAKLELLNKDFGVTLHENSFDVWCGSNNNYYTLPYPALRGKEQVHNVALGLAIISKLQLDFPTPLQAIKTALLETKLVGRFDVMPGLPQTVFDVAHNPQAVKTMLENMVKLPFAKHNFAVFGIAADKDYQQVIQISAGSFDKWYVATLDSPRGLDAAVVAQTLIANNIQANQIIICDNIEAAMQRAKQAAGENDRIMCFGSFLVVASAYQQYKKDNQLNAT